MILKFHLKPLIHGSIQMCAKICLGEQRIESYPFVHQGLYKLGDIHTVEYSAAVEIKKVTLSVWICNKLHNFLSFTEEQRSMYKKGRGTYACIYIEYFWRDAQEI